jgi:hypothetical protein
MAQAKGSAEASFSPKSATEGSLLHPLLFFISNGFVYRRFWI